MVRRRPPLEGPTLTVHKDGTGTKRRPQLWHFTFASHLAAQVFLGAHIEEKSATALQKRQSVPRS
jgi:hypothetical protein